MVWFQYDDGCENLKKPKLVGHFLSCSTYMLSCIECDEFFSQGTVQGNTQCISEAEKYDPKGQNKPSNGGQGKPDKPKPNADVDTNVGLSMCPPWFCSLCKTTTTSQQTLLLHADGKKHREKTKAFHAYLKQANGNEQTEDNKESGGAPAVESKQVNGEKSDNSKAEGKHAGKRNMIDDNATEQPDNAKRPNLSSSTGEVIQSENRTSENKAKSECKNVDKQKIKWKKIITKSLKVLFPYRTSDGSIKLKKLQRVVIKELQDCGFSEDKDRLLAALMDEIASSSRFSVDGKHIRLVGKNQEGS